MRFGHWLYWTNLDPSRDAQMVHDALAEARLAEELGYDAVWFAEHHFLGEVGYGDPVVFATAVAMQNEAGTPGPWRADVGNSPPGADCYSDGLVGQPEPGPLAGGHLRRNKDAYPGISRLRHYLGSGPGAD